MALRKVPECFKFVEMFSHSSAVVSIFDKSGCRIFFCVPFHHDKAMEVINPIRQYLRHQPEPTNLGKG